MTDPNDEGADSVDATTPTDADPIEGVLDVLTTTAPEIRDSLVGRREYVEGENPSGEDQLAADVHADELLEDRLLAIEGVGTYVSEEREDTIERGAGLSVAVDPLDGSSNLTSNNAMGTIVGVYDAALPASGRDLVAAAYVLYGPITTMTTAVKGCVTEYVIEDGAARDATRHVARENLALPDDPTVYGFGGRVPDWPAKFADYASEVESDSSLKLRYGGTMIADVNQVLCYGGVFAYPALSSAPEGKLRLQFEANPIAAIVEAAGGRSSDGERSLLDVEPTDIHQRVPVHVGSPGLIDRLEAMLGEEGAVRE